MTSPDSRMNWNKPSSYSRGKLPSQLPRQDLHLRLNSRLLATQKYSGVQGHKCHLCRTCRYSRSRLKPTNHSLRAPRVNLKPWCLDSRSATVRREPGQAPHNTHMYGLLVYQDLLLRTFLLNGSSVFCTP